MNIRKGLLGLLISGVVLTVGCSTLPKEWNIGNGGNAATEEQEKKYFWENGVTDDTIAVIINKFTKEQYKTLGETTKVTLDDGKEKILLIPTEDNTNIQIWAVENDNGKIVDKELKYELKEGKKNTVLELQVTIPEGAPNYKIKISNKAGSLEYLLTYDGKDGVEDIQYLTVVISEDTATGDSDSSNNVSGSDTSTSSTDSQLKNLSLAIFIPDGDHEIKYDGSDLSSNHNYIKGDGKNFQVIGTNGKGPFVNVYTLKDGEIYITYSADLTESDMANVSTLNYLDKNTAISGEPILVGPIEVGTRWANKEIVEVGNNLKIGDLTLKGAYVKTWEKTVQDGKEVVSVYYYSQGLGCVQSRVLIDGEVVEHSSAIEVISDK